MNKLFFFDTADVEYIKNTWEKLYKSQNFFPSDVVGVTTNPNALDKISCKTVREFQKVTRELCKVIHEIRYDDEGVVYVQLPNCNMPKTEIMKFVEEILQFSDGHTKVGLKIPPYKNVLDLVDELNSKLHDEVNVTGIADCSTALKCFTYKVKYVSIIPGRMEEKGVNAKEQISFVNQRNDAYNKKIITGSMRTLEGLRWAIEYETIPTIGSRVFDLILSAPDGIKQFSEMWPSVYSETYRQLKLQSFSPLITEEMTKLSKSFFEQMDKLGQPLYEDFKIGW